jgi:hypothetical protein
MRLSSFFTTVMSTFTVASVTVFGLSSLAQAQALGGSSSGIWGEPNAGSLNSDPKFTGVGTNIFTWGEPNVPGRLVNQLLFKGNNFTGDIGSLFKIGDLTYYNGIVKLGTSVDFVPLNLELSLSNPVKRSEAFNFNFQLINTPNGSIDPQENADFVVVSENFGDRNFIFNNEEYTIELTGFSQDNGITSTNQFRVLEEKETTAAIFARITTLKPAKKVPEPGAIAGLSLLGVYLVCRKSSIRKMNG